MGGASRRDGRAARRGRRGGDALDDVGRGAGTGSAPAGARVSMREPRCLAGSGSACSMAAAATAPAAVAAQAGAGMYRAANRERAQPVLREPAVGRAAGTTRPGPARRRCPRRCRPEPRAPRRERWPRRRGPGCYASPRRMSRRRARRHSPARAAQTDAIAVSSPLLLVVLIMALVLASVALAKRRRHPRPA